MAVSRKGKQSKPTTVKSGDAVEFAGMALNQPVRFEVERGGTRHAGQAVLVNEWSSELGMAPPDGEAFRIVLVARSMAINVEEISSPRVVVNVVGEVTDETAHISEASAPYGVEKEEVAHPVSKAWEGFRWGTIVVGRDGGPESANAVWQHGEAEALRRLALLADLEGFVAQAVRVREYLELAEPPESDDELYIDRLSLIEQASGKRAAMDQEVWPSILALFEGYKSRYIGAYLRHHRAYRIEVASLQKILDAAQPKVNTLKLLNQIKELGEPVGEAALTAAIGLLERQTPCTRMEQTLTALGSEPVCPACGVPMKASPPTQVVRRTLEYLDEALVQQRRRLSAEAVRQVLARPIHGLDQFLQVIQASDLKALDEVMDEDLAQFISKLLSEATVEISLSSMLQELEGKYPEVDEAETEAYGQAVKGFLDHAVEEARKANPGKRIRLKVQ
ncbi:MAG: hypothetical protein IIC82_08670 [Chloroflexi bacterium]|nr:hypothetical protein [Chloroflexota bacterium]